MRLALRRGLTAASGVAVALQAAPAMTAVPAIRRRFPRLAGQGQTDRVALTFDDGPDDASTPQFLELLRRRRVRCTFFVLGEMAERFPDLPKRMVDEGHELAVHSWDHRNHLRHPPGRRTSDQLERTADLLRRLTGSEPSWFRPPYGVLTAADVRAARATGLTPVLWTAWGRDWTSHATSESVLRTVTASLQPGGTVLLHDSDCTSAAGAWRSALGALPGLLDWCERRDMLVGPLRDHGIVGA